MGVKPVLVVEDEPDIRDNMRMLLEDEGYRVYCAANGQQALDVLHAQKLDPPGLIALDLFMPIMDGRQFLAAFAAEQRRTAALGKVAVVLVTASDASARGDLIGKTLDILKKPVNVEKLLTLVARNCGSPDVPA